MEYIIERYASDDFRTSEKIGNRYIIRTKIEDLPESESVRCVESIIDHSPAQADYDAQVASYVGDVQQEKLSCIRRYDVSDNVNIFYIDEYATWLDKDTRVGLDNLIKKQKEAGATETTLWLAGVSFVIEIDHAIDLLRQLEIYAGQCYNKTEEHKAAVLATTTIAGVENYDYTTGYPEPLHFTISNNE
jgi:hypothetical protein